MPATELRRIRVEEPIAITNDNADLTLAPGEYFIEEQPGSMRLHADPSGANSVARVAAADFNGWLDRRQLVFLSWG